MAQGYKPKKGDKAQFRGWKAPAARYEDRWATVTRSNRTDNTVNISYPKNHRSTPMNNVSVDSLKFKRGNLVFTVSA